MKYYLLIPLLLALCLVQAAVMPAFTVFGIWVNLPLVVLTCWAMIRGQQESMVLVVVAGLAMGILTSEPLGASILTLAPVPLLANVRELRVTGSDLIPTLPIVAAAVLAYHAIEAILALFLGLPVDWLRLVYRVIGPELAVSLLITPVIYWATVRASVDRKHQVWIRW